MNMKEEGNKEKQWSLKAVCAVALVAFTLGGAVAVCACYAVSVGCGEKAEAVEAAEEADRIVESEKETETPVVTALGETENAAADVTVSGEERILREYLEERLLEFEGTVDLEEQARTFDWCRTYTIYRMADGHMAWTNISGICGSEICDLDGDGVEELIVFELAGDVRMMGSGEMSIQVYEVHDGKAELSGACPEYFPSDAGGSELSWSLLPADDAVYLFYHDSYRGVGVEHDSTNEAALYRYDGENFYSPLRIRRTTGEASKVTYTAYQYDTGEKLLSKEVIYESSQDMSQDRESMHYDKRVEELLDAYGIHSMETKEEQRLLTLNMWAVRQGDFQAHTYQVNDQNDTVSVYQRFLNGEEPARIREGVWDEYDGGPDEAWTIQELLEMVCGYYLEDDRYPQITGGYRPSIGYTYLDCGGDGVKELTIRFAGLGIESTEDLTMVIACHDGRLEVVYARHSWSRSSNELGYHGCIRHHGSDGARDNHAGMDYIDGNGDLQMVYSAHALGRQGWALCELENYDDTNASAYAFTDTTYSIGDAEYEILEFDEDIPEETGREYMDYLERQGRNVITEEELAGLIEARMEQLGIEKTWAEEEELAWSYCYW